MVLGQGFRWGSLAMAAGGLLLCLPRAYGVQTSAGPTEAKAPCAAPGLPSFEVESIRPVPPSKQGYTSIGATGLPRLDWKNVSLSLLISYAYNVRTEYMGGETKGLESANFDVQATSAEGAPLTYEALKPLLQSLLMRRFCLVAQRGTKPISGYALVVARGGSKLKALSPAEVSGSKSSSTIQAGGSAAYITRDSVYGADISMGTLAGMLASPVGRPVTDETKLPGEYAISLKFAPEGASDSALPSIFTVLKEQLGLELRSAPVPVDTLTIERINRVPSEN